MRFFFFLLHSFYKIHGKERKMEKRERKEREKTPGFFLCLKQGLLLALREQGLLEERECQRTLELLFEKENKRR